jgi:molybdenum cofactor cytidylyltransferase
MKRVSAILLAAGESCRMGEVNKLTLPVRGVPLLRHMVCTLLESELHEIVVVTGHQPETARALLQGLAVSLVDNHRYREGQMTSVYCGMQALREPCAGVMVCLSDQPLLSGGDINRLIHTFLEQCPTSVLVPVYRGRRGNPIILAHAHREAILAGERNLGCRRLIEKNPDLVTPFEWDNDHVVFDLDTPSDYQRLVHRLAPDELAATETCVVSNEG